MREKKGAGRRSLSRAPARLAASAAPAGCALLLLAAVVSVVASASGAQPAIEPGFRGAPSGLAAADAPATAPALTCGPIEMTQSTSQVVNMFNSVACVDTITNVTLENSYYRAFDLASFGLVGFSACEVQVGIEQATGGGGSGMQPLTVNLYMNSGGPFPGGTSILVGSAAVMVSDQALIIFAVPVTGIAAARSELVVEILIPDGTAAGNMFWIGSNAAPETGPGYIRAPACGVATPMTTAALGFPDMHIVMNVEGSGGPSAPVPVLGGGAMTALLSCLALFGLTVTAWRRRHGTTANADCRRR